MKINTGGTLNSITGKPQDKMYRYPPRDVTGIPHKLGGTMKPSGGSCCNNCQKARGCRKGGFMWAAPIIASVAPFVLNKLFGKGKRNKKSRRR